MARLPDRAARAGRSLEEAAVVPERSAFALQAAVGWAFRRSEAAVVPERSTSDFVPEAVPAGALQGEAPATAAVLGAGPMDAARHAAAVVVHALRFAARVVAASAVALLDAARHAAGVVAASAVALLDVARHAAGVVAHALPFAAQGRVAVSAVALSGAARRATAVVHALPFSAEELVAEFAVAPRGVARRAVAYALLVAAELVAAHAVVPALARPGVAPELQVLLGVAVLGGAPAAVGLGAVSLALPGGQEDVRRVSFAPARWTGLLGRAIDRAKARPISSSLPLRSPPR